VRKIIVHKQDVTQAAELTATAEACHNDVMSLIGPTLSIRGEIVSAEDLILDGKVDGGPVWNEANSVTVTAGAVVNADVIARRITVLGKVTGMLLASNGVELRATAQVEGRVLASTFALDEGAVFHGTVEPQQMEAALKVARHRHAG
jgi:cytoskeletal protein CcmA (bactofilin family)